ncbi:DegT/DnrJ/EryC1/StrS family aminotransferase [Pelagibacteraceae bacterium]|nr:DegT/DnrJ/EryC1/StrS family aminotransferase [Pelagibacteraceae bacterium]
MYRKYNKINHQNIFGKNKTIKYKFKKINQIGKEEINTVNHVMRSGILSDFIASEGLKMFGGKKVLEFEKKICNFFNVKHAITFNSWTSGLIAAVGSLDVEPGDEIILSPWTMSATAMAILHWNCIPIFADIDIDTFCIDPESVIKNISKRTKAIVAIDIFGHSSNIIELKKICKKYSLKLILDTAQAPGAKNAKKFAGTQGDIGGFSLNYHKHIHTGEGGIVVTNNSYYAKKIKFIRNHGESLVKTNNYKFLSNMIGYNFRMGEIEAAIGIEQLKKLNKFVKKKQEIGKKLNEGLKNLHGLIIPTTKKFNSHVYYLYPLKLDTKKIKVNKNILIKALEFEGVQGLISQYQNLHLLPIFQNKIAYGKKHFPWSIVDKNRKINYKKGICPNAEFLNDKSFFAILLCLYDLNTKDINLIIKSFNKVWSNLKSLK